MSVYPRVLSETGAPWFLALRGSVQEATGRAYAWAADGLTVRFLRSRKMLTYQGLFDEVAAALQFPWYFGENGNAFDECITDLSWLPPQAGFVFPISEPAKVLSSTDDNGLSWLINILSRASEQWSTPVHEGQPWDRSPVPFHVVLQVESSDSDEALAAWTASGAEITSVD